VLRSPHAHAKIVSIDTAAAKRSPGVLAVYTIADLDAEGIQEIPTQVDVPAKTAPRCSRRPGRSWRAARCGLSAIPSPMSLPKASNRRATPPN
jgi:CO/xanthine dehydrogenase Mo-binding subunit